MSRVALIGGGGFIGHNLAKFDLPFIWKRSVINNVPTCKGVKWNDAKHGYSCYDTMTAWAGYGNRISADNLCKLLGIKGKTEGMDGSVFRQPYGRPSRSVKQGYKNALNRAGLEKKNYRFHDLRHSFASVGAGAGLSLPIIGKLLGHTQAATTQRYAHLAADPVRQAADRISGEIAAAMNGRPKGEVTPIRR